MNFKESMYNIRFRFKDHEYIFNSLRCSLVKLSDTLSKNSPNSELCEIIRDEEDLKVLKSQGILVNKQFEEFEFLKYLNMRSRFSFDTLTLTLFPTMSCNCKCTYCYENNIKYDRSIMSRKVCDDILHSIESVAKLNKNISIIWHGGEPLLAKDVIWYISNNAQSIAKKYNVKYSSFIISNLCLVDDDIIENLLKYNILNIQCTIDGLPEVHNRKRVLKNGNPTFDLIINNILKLQSKGISVDLRLNIDKYNKNDITKLVDLLIDKRIHIEDNVYLGHLKDYKNKSNDYLNVKEYSDACISLYEHLIKKIPNINFDSWFPKFKGKFCQADSYGSLSIDYSGNIYKCWHDVGNPLYMLGNVCDFDFSVCSKSLSYALRPLDMDIKCQKCKILPLCLGGCQKYRIYNDYCLEYVYNLVDILKIFINKNSHESQDSNIFVLKQANDVNKLF